MSTVMLPDEVFHSQVCSECYQYLSYPPITVTKLGEKICGRCLPSFQSTNGNKKTCAPSLLNLVMEDVEFKCVNHFDGCRKLLGIKDVEEHEKQCKFKKRECFFCSFLGDNWSQILNHCKVAHSESISKKGQFSFVLNQEDYKSTFILIVENSVLIISIVVNDQKFTAVIESANKDMLGTNQLAVKFFTLIRESDYVIDYLKLDLSSENYFEKQLDELISEFGYNIEIYCQFVVRQFSFSEKDLEIERKFVHVNKLHASLLEKEKQISKEMSLVKEQSDMFLSLKNVMKKLAFTLFNCQKCKTQLVGDDVYICPKNHFYCHGCLTRVCTTCGKPCEFSKLPLDFTKITVSCDWPNCPETQLPIHDYIEHKYYCKFRPYKCPLNICTAVVYSSQELHNHWHSAIPALLKAEEHIICDQHGDFEFYWFVDNDLYHFIIEFQIQSLRICYEPVNNLKDVRIFKCQGYIKVHNVWIDHGAFQNFCGKMQLVTNNVVSYSRSNFNCDKIRIFQ